MSEPRFIPLNPCFPNGAIKFQKSNIRQSLADIMPDGQLTATYSGTSALGLSARSLKKMGVCHLLAPSFNCGHEIEPFRRQGFKISFYRIDQKGQYDLETLAPLLQGRHQVLMVTHYFGFTQSIKDLKDLCRDNGVWLLEDCAHALLSWYDNRLLGSYGDLAIFSLRKTLPLPDGGAVIINHPDLHQITPNAKPTMLSVGKKTVKIVLDRLFLMTEENHPIAFEISRKAKGALMMGQTIMKSPFRSNSLHFFSPDDESYDFDDQILKWDISKISRHLLSRMNFDDIQSKRRTNYQYVLDALKDQKRLTPLFGEIPDGICPLEFPLVPPFHHRAVEDVMADYPFLYKWWPYFHQSVPWNNFPESRWLKNSCCIIAIHQDMERRHLDFLIDCAVDAEKRL